MSCRKRLKGSRGVEKKGEILKLKTENLLEG